MIRREEGRKPKTINIGKCQDTRRRPIYTTTIRVANQEYIDLKDVITKVEVKLDVETNLIIGINTLLDTVSITLQDSSRGTF